MFLFKAIYILFWTFVLNAICKAGYKEVSWFMVLLPIILLFIIIGMIILNSGSVTLFEGFKEGMDNPSCSNYTKSGECNNNPKCKWEDISGGVCEVKDQTGVSSGSEVHDDAGTSTGTETFRNMFR